MWWQPQLLYVVVGGGGKPTAGDVAVRIVQRNKVGRVCVLT